MATLWDKGGPPPTQDRAGLPAATATSNNAPSNSVKWGEELDTARAEMGRGFYFSALRRLDRLLTDAPDLIEAARAVELRALTRDVLRARPAATAATASAATGASVVEDGPAAPPPPPPPSSSARPSTTHWYGWQTLIADGAALITTPVAPLGGFALYCTGSPIVHLAHGNVKNAGLSVGLRLGAPMLGGLFGYALGRAGDGNSGPSYGTAILAALGILGGGVTAIVVDHAVIAREPAEENDKPTSSAGSPKMKTAMNATNATNAMNANASARPAHKAVIESIRPSGGPRKDGGFDLGIVGIW